SPIQFDRRLLVVGGKGPENHIDDARLAAALNCLFNVARVGVSVGAHVQARGDAAIAQIVLSGLNVFDDSLGSLPGSGEQIIFVHSVDLTALENVQDNATRGDFRNSAVQGMR